jgi:hypothetical protein
MNKSDPRKPSTSQADGTAEAAFARVGSQGPFRGQESFFRPVPAWVWFFAVVAMSWGYFTSNPALTVCSLMMLPMLASVLWFRNEPPVLLFACCIQWLQATTAIFYANFQGLPLYAELNLGGDKVEEATWLSMAGVFVLAAGMRIALINRERNAGQKAQQEARLVNLDRVFVVYLISFAFSSVLDLVAFAIPGLTQPLLALGTIRWTMVFLLVYSVIVNRQRYALLSFVVCLEAITGLTGFFSSFKSVFYVLLIALAGTGLALKGWRLTQFIAVAMTVFALSVLWTAIKPEYRSFLSEGADREGGSIPVTQRLEKVGELTSSMDLAKLNEGFEDLLLRISYVKYFALTIQNVPVNVPYERGGLWAGAIEQVFMPRLFFPDKPKIDDSERTGRYTGTEVSGREQGTSISIGYFGESYIDFGPVGMFAPIFLLGMFYGLIYRLFVKYSQRKIIGFAIAVSTLVFSALQVETSNIKIVGGSVVVCLAMSLFLRIGAKPIWNSIARQLAPLPIRPTPEIVLHSKAAKRAQDASATDVSP